MLLYNMFTIYEKYTHKQEYLLWHTKCKIPNGHTEEVEEVEEIAEEQKPKIERSFLWYYRL